MKNILIQFFMWYLKNGENHQEKTVEELIQFYLDERDNKRND